MAYLLKKDRTIHVEIEDAQTGEVYSIYCRSPKASDIQAYQASMWTRKGRKLRFDAGGAQRTKVTLELITGIGEGCYEDDKGPISSDPQSKDYREGWKDLLYECAYPHILKVTDYLFNTIRDPGAGLEIEDGEIEGGDAVPFEKRSTE